jgi:hypothetical protein
MARGKTFLCTFGSYAAASLIFHQFSFCLQTKHCFDVHINFIEMRGIVDAFLQNLLTSRFYDVII